MPREFEIHPTEGWSVDTGKMLTEPVAALLDALHLIGTKGSETEWNTCHVMHAIHSGIQYATGCTPAQVYELGLLRAEQRLAAAYAAGSVTLIEPVTEDSPLYTVVGVDHGRPGGDETAVFAAEIEDDGFVTLVPVRAHVDAPVRPFSSDHGFRERERGAAQEADAPRAGITFAAHDVAMIRNALAEIAYTASLAHAQSTAAYLIEKMGGR